MVLNDQLRSNSEVPLDKQIKLLLKQVNGSDLVVVGISENITVISLKVDIVLILHIPAYAIGRP